MSLNVNFNLEIDGVVTPVSTSISLDHTETPNTASPSVSPENNDLISIDYGSTPVVEVVVGDRVYEVEILGFLDGGNLVRSVETVETQETSYQLWAEVRSTDDLPEVVGSVDVDPLVGADGAASVNAIVWANESGGEVAGTYGTLDVDSDGNYTYTMSRSARDAAELGDDLSETFYFTVTDEDGDSATSSIILNLNPVQNALLVDGIVAGIAYETSSGLEGITSEDGQFSYRYGDSVTFSIGGVVLGAF